MFEFIIQSADTIIQLFQAILPYAWGTAAIVVAPFVGYAVIQRFKPIYKPMLSDRANTAISVCGSGLITWFVSMMLWFKQDGDFGNAALLGMVMGALQPFITRWAFARYKQKNPEVYEALATGTETQIGFLHKEKVDV